MKPILEKADSSEFEVVADGEINKLQRMAKKKFETLLFNFQNSKTMIEDFVKDL